MSSPADEPASVRRALEQEPEGFDFFQAVRILEWSARLEAKRGRPPGTAPSVGEDRGPLEDPVRFRASAGLGFPASTVTGMARTGGSGADAAPPEMTVAFMGLTGPSGVLPLHYSDHVLRETRARNPALRDFLDLFNHRLVSLFYRAWAKYRLPVSFERRPRGTDPVTAIIAALVGLGGEGLRNRLCVDDMTVFHFGGAYARRAPSAASLEGILSAHFALTVEIRPFRARWVRLAPPERSALPFAGSEGSAFARLGMDAIAGEMVFDAGGNFRVRVGAMPYRAFAGFVPGGKALREIVDLTRLYVGPELDFDIQCVIRRDETPMCRLGGDEAPGNRLGDDAASEPRLGWNCWLACAEREDDADDPVFASDAV